MLAASGEYRRDYMERPVSSALEEAMGSRTSIRKEGAAVIPLVTGENTSQTAHQLIAPIQMDGQPIGAIALLSRDGAISEAGQKSAEAAVFLGRQMQQ